MDNKRIANQNEIYYNTLLRLFWGFAIFQFFNHLVFFLIANDPRMLMPASIAYVHDLLILSLFYIAEFYVARVLPKRIRSFGEKLLIVFFLTIAASLSLYPRILREYLVFPVNILESDVATARTLIVEYLGLSSFIPLIIALVFGVILIYIKREIKVTRKIKIMIITPIMLLAVFFLQTPSPHPFVYSVQMQIEKLINAEERVVSSLEVTAKSDYGLISPLQYPPMSTEKYNHVVMIVFEGVTAENFEQKFIKIPNGFYENNYSKTHYYQNYYTNNLDSYTSLIAMTTGIQVPYRCYSDDKLYEQVNQESNLVDYFNKNGFKSLFVSTFEHHPYIPSKQFWSDIYIRKDFENIDKYSTIGTSKMERATEDKAAIDAMVSYMKRNDNTFILHELAYGHSPEWRATIGKEQLDYYNEYLIELSEKIKQNDLFDKTLFIIVSDHGDRTKTAEAENYRVPLLIVGKELKQEKNPQFLSHLDFPQITFSALGIDLHPSGTEEIYVVGSSEKWNYGKIMKKGSLFINNAKGIILSQTGNMSAEEIRSGFQKYLNEFNLKYGENRTSK